ncbi:MAG: 30S ribosomal protein S12 methylthiotransferase RimO [Clostridia bacterium]|jgi:ribosomal protein S12 methylthiotransferase|nr:30S ribosomal protein S12 methylthiotransferase RimO [Clostridia bacterium]
MKVGFISLGCNKNLVDTEKTIALFQKHNYEIVNNPKQAEMIVVNTCGFIQTAKEEAISTILEMAEYKKQNCKYLIAMGCLVERYKEELQKALPEVDLYIKYSSYDTLWEQIQNLVHVKEVQNEKPFDELIERTITTGKNYAYLKIADGCSNCCTYCAIPKIRGPLKSRSIESIVQEANWLAKEGYQEIIVTAQDTTKYGIDIYGKPMLANLLKELCKIEKIKWIRFLYAYPETITDELIEVIKENPKICSYFDIPIQHIADNVLKRMNRQSNGNSIRNLIKKLRKKLPGVILRTTVMVGFPGETKEDFEELYEFLKEAKFDKLGAFSYSKEEGTAAAFLKEQIHPATKKARYNKIMELQQIISKENLEEKVGKEFQVMVEGITKNKKFYVGRSYMDVPEIDGIIYIENTKELTLGEFVLCKIDRVKSYDLIGKIKK